MASATSHEILTAIYHHPINASSQPTPAKPPSQEAEHMTQVPRSPVVSQRSTFVIASQKDIESLIRDSLERHPETPARQFSNLPYLYEQTAPLHNDQIVQDSYEEKPDASSPSIEHQVVTHNTLELPLAGHPAFQYHAPGEDSAGLVRPEQPSEQTTTVLQQSAGTQSLIPSQTATNTREPIKASPLEHTAAGDEEDIQDCITVRAPPITPSARTINETTKVTSAVIQSAFHSAGDISSPAPLNRSRSSLPNVSAITALTTSSMPPKPSSTTKSPSTSQERKGTSTTSKKSSKAVPPSVNIVNHGETSAIASLQKLRAGGTSQVNVTRQTAEATTKTVTRAEISEKAPARPTKAPATKLATKSPQQRQSQRRSLANKQVPRRAEDSDGFDEFAVPQSPGAPAEIAAPKPRAREKAKSQRKAKSDVLSVPPVKKANKSQPRKEAVRSADTDDEDDDEEYSAPKASRSTTSRATRASTRAQTKSVTQGDVLNVSNRGDVASATTKGAGLESGATKSAATKRENLVPQRPARSKTPEEHDDFEDIMDVDPISAVEAHMNFVHISRRPRADISSATAPVATKAKDEQKIPLERARFSPSYTPAREPGTTPRHPISLNDDNDSSDDEGVTSELLDNSYNDIVHETTNQKQQEKQGTFHAEELSLTFSFGEAQGSPIRQQPRPIDNQHLDPLVEERTNRKPNIVGFNHAGPKNQGTANKRDSRSDPATAFEEDASSPDLDQFSVQASLPPHTIVPSSHKQPTTAHETRVIKLPAPDHTVLTVDVSAAPEEAVPIIPKPTVVQCRKAAASIEVPRAEMEGLMALEMSKKLATNGLARLKPIEDLADSHVQEREHIETSVHSRFSKSAVGGRPHHTTMELEDRFQKPQSTLRASVALLPEGMSLKPRIARGTRASIADNSVQGLSKHRESEPAKQRANAQPSSEAPNFNNYDELEPVISERATSLSIQYPPRTGDIKASVPLVQKERTKIKNTQSRIDQSASPIHNPKRPTQEMTNGPAKVLRTSTREPELESDLTAAATRPATRRVFQVADHGSPIADGEDLPQSTKLVERKRDGMPPGTSIPPLRLTQEHSVDPFDQFLALKPRQEVRYESPLEGTESTHQSSPGQNSQAVTHVGFDGDTQANANSGPSLESSRKPLKITHPKRHAHPPQRALTVHTSLISLMDTLRPEGVPRSGQRGRNEEDDRKELSQADEPQDEEDPDKTLVNRDSDDGDGDDDDSQSRDSSDISDGEPKRALSMWRQELESHQGVVFEQLVRMAHRLTNHLKDHETAIKDISMDFTQDGRRLVKRFEKNNEEQLEEYCLKKSKMEGALALGCKQVYAFLQKDVKEVTTSSESYVKALHKQVDAGGRLDQILRTYHS
ncbi:hypothetical protein E4T39_02530 [Aureobasidium subglaciale]|nr:hypothetical protein E4T39_02530 [Aureobasidium subglaciale]